MRVEIKVQELGTWIRVPDSPYLGRNSNKAWSRGFSARCMGYPISICPYLAAFARDYWHAGWKKADEMIVERQLAQDLRGR